MIEDKRGSTIYGSDREFDRPRLLIVEHNASTTKLMLQSLGRACLGPGVAEHVDPAQMREISCACGDREPRAACCVVIGSLGQLHRFNLDRCDVVICAVHLPDGCGLDALAYVRGVRPELPVLLIGNPGETTVAVEAIRAGALDFLVASSADLRALPLALEKCLAHQRIKYENEQLHLDLSRSLDELARKNQQLQDANRKLEAMARTDDLTGLYNRRYLNEQLDRAWAQAVRSDRPLAFMMIDLDRFKETNDRFGHQHGDAVLRRAAKVIEANCRQVDVTARYGGDEFCVLMPNTEVQEAVRVAERILREYENANGVKSEHEPRLGMSIGIAHIDLSRPANAEQLIRHADEAMYAAKSDAANRAMLRDADGVYAPSSGERVSAPDYRRPN